MKTIDLKLRKLENILKEMQGLVVAFSGGIDSSFLLKKAHDVLGKKVLAVTAVSPAFPMAEQNSAKKLARSLGVRQRLIRSHELSIPEFADNPPNRCYYCKKDLFTRLLEIARAESLPWVADGSNSDDTQDFRPGAIAAKELGIRKPLLEARLGKKEIRMLSREMGLPTADKPSAACLSSRLPYGEAITAGKLKQIGRAEEFLHKLGFTQVRVRQHGGIARIEVLPAEMGRFLERGIQSRVARQLRALGYQYVTLDLQGYRTGSMNEVLKKAASPQRSLRARRKAMTGKTEI
jgi:pyridinium-3,5-biscarboxylic acid mononucleotide sulfurtransferase